MQTFSDTSPQKRLLNYCQLTPAKVNVGCDINGWLQTYQKQPVVNGNKKLPKYIHARFNLSKKDKQNIVPFKKMNRTDQAYNLLSLTKLKPQQQSLTTKCKTSEIRSREQNNQIPQEQINISVFDIQTNKQDLKQKLKQNPHTFLKMPQISVPSECPSKITKIKPVSLLSDRMDQRKRRISRILSNNHNNNRLKNQIVKSETLSSTPNGLIKVVTSYSRKLSLINKSREIVKGNLTTNQKLALNMIIKKGEGSSFVGNCLMSANQACPGKNNVLNENKMTFFKFFNGSNARS